MVNRREFLTRSLGMTLAWPILTSATLMAPWRRGTAVASAAPDEAVLLFTIGMHIEPFGAVPSALVAEAAGKARGGPDYNQPGLFERHVADILTVTAMVEAHGGRMTIQAQSPFTIMALQTGNPVLAGLAQHGHEIGLHFHEDAHLGTNSAALPVETWCTVMEEELGLIREASGVSRIRYWSGGNLYPQLYQAAACAGLDVNSDWKNPRTQTTDLTLVGIHPWRPAGGTDGTDLTLFIRHDPSGAIVFLPEGQYDKDTFAATRRSEDTGGDEAYFAYLASALMASLAVAQADRVNVFHFTVHPGEFRGDPAHPFAVIERFLSEVVDPLVESGLVRWATLSEMADAFIAWEAVHPGVDPRETAPATAAATD